MRRLEGRIRRIEDRLNVNKEALRILIVSYSDYAVPERPEDVEDKLRWQDQLLESLGPYGEWLTVRPQIEAVEKARVEGIEPYPPEDSVYDLIEISPNPCAELEARKRQKATKSDKSPENGADE